MISKNIFTTIENRIQNNADALVIIVLYLKDSKNSVKLHYNPKTRSKDYYLKEEGILANKEDVSVYLDYDNISTIAYKKLDEDRIEQEYEKYLKNSSYYKVIESLKDTNKDINPYTHEILELTRDLNEKGYFL